MVGEGRRGYNRIRKGKDKSMENTKEFLEFATSLKLIRKAEIEKDGRDILDLVYTDLLPNNGILEMVNLPRTSILKGRKGTGKSTIFKKSQKDMLDNPEVITIYIDVKTLFDSATPTLNIDGSVEGCREEIKKYFIYKNFLFEVINKSNINFKETIKKRHKFKDWLQLHNVKMKRIDAEFEEMKSNIEQVNKKIDLSLYQKIHREEEFTNMGGSKLDLELSENPQLRVSVEDSDENIYKNEFTSVIQQYFDIKKCLVDQLLNIRKVLGVKYIYIYLDDYSEMDEEAQEIFMDWFVAPLNNISEDFVKFKIATYPNRFYYGKLDNQKIDEINLDFYGALYSYKNISKMEDIAVDYIKRLIENRFRVFLHERAINDYFDVPAAELYELLFDMSLNTPRILGFIFTYCHATHITLGKKITKAALNMAAQRYFEEVTEQYFETNKFVLNAFDEMASRENLKCLVEKFIKKQIENDNIVNKKAKKMLPTSHFLVDNNLCKLLETLELNGYISIYNKIKDKDNVASTLYSLDYGLCQKYNLSFGRPKDTELRKYYQERKFTFNNLIKEHFNSSQMLECPNGHTFPFEQYDMLNAFGMICPKCAQNQVFVKCETHVTNRNIIELIDKYSSNTARLQDDLEFSILNFLRYNKDRAYCASEVAENLDCSYQLITKRADKLIDRELLAVDREHSKRKRYFFLTKEAKDMLEAN